MSTVCRFFIFGKLFFGAMHTFFHGFLCSLSTGTFCPKYALLTYY